MIVVGKNVVEWVARKTNEFGNFGTDIGIGWAKPPLCFEPHTYAGFDSAYGNLVAGVAYANWNGVNIEAHIASDGSKRWLTREYLWTIFDYPFRQLKVKRITLCIGEGNKDSRRFAEHLGFERETTLVAAHPTGDLLIYRMTKDMCRWTRAEFYKQYALAA